MGFDISRNIQPTQENAQKIKEQLELYGRKSDAFSHKDLSEKQEREVKAVREKYREDHKSIRRQLPPLIEAKKQELKKVEIALQRQRDKVEQVRAQRIALFKQLNTAVDNFLSATTTTMNDRLEEFTALRKKMHLLLRDLPRSDERTNYFKEVDALSDKVRDHQRKVEQSLKAVAQQVQEREKIIEEEVDDFVAKGGSLLQLFLLTAPPEVQNAVNELMHDKNVLAILKDNRQLCQLLALMDTNDVGKALQQLTDGSEGLVALSPNNQITALETILEVLGHNTDAKSENVVLACQFLGTVVKGIRDLQKGDKEYVTFVTESGGFAKVIHFSFYDLIYNPSAISNFYLALLQQGKITPKFHVQFTSPKQAAAISFVINNMDVKALTEHMGSLSQEDLLGLTQGHMGGALVQSSSGALVQGRPKVGNFSDVITFIAHSAGNVKSLARALGTKAPELEHELTQILGQLKINSAPHSDTQPEIFSLLKKLATLFLLGQDLDRLIGLPKGSVEGGAINSFVNSSFFPSEELTLGNTVILIDSRSGREKRQSILGMVPTQTLQLPEGHKQSSPLPITHEIDMEKDLLPPLTPNLDEELTFSRPTTDLPPKVDSNVDLPLTSIPRPVVQPEILIFNQFKNLQQRTSRAERALEEERERSKFEKEELRNKLAQKLIEVTKLHGEEKVTLQQEIERLKVELHSLGQTSQKTIISLEQELSRLTKELDQQAKKHLKSMKEALEQIREESRLEQVKLKKQYDETLRAVSSHYGKEQEKLKNKITQLEDELLRLKTTSENTIAALQIQLNQATESYEAKLKKQKQSAKEALQKVRVEKEQLQSEMDDNLEIIELYETEMDVLKQELSNKEEEIQWLENQLQRVDQIERRNFEQQRLIEELLNAQNKKTVDLSAQAEQYGEFLKAFEGICNVLHVKEAADSIYSDATDIAEDVYHALNEIGRGFFANPTPETFASFKAICRESMAAAAVELRQHDDIWSSYL